MTPTDQVTARAAPGSGRAAPLQFGWRMPMWDPDEAPARAWLPDVWANLEALRGKLDSVWLSDHVVPGTSWMPPHPDTLECWTATSFIAAAFPEYHYGQIVLANSFRHPPLLAKMAATLQLLTGGRLILGIGAGWMESEYRMYGWEYPPPGPRLQQLDEAVQIIRLMWTRAPASFEGRHYRIENACCNPLPDPPPPIMIGSSGEKRGLRIVAQHGDWWNTSGIPPEELNRRAGVLAKHCEVVGRDVTSILYTWQSQAVALADSEREARAIAEASRIFRESKQESPLIGTPEQIAARLEEYVAVGVRHFILRFLDFPRTDGALRFAAEVAPKLRRPG